MKISDYDNHPSILASNETSKEIKEQQERAEMTIAEKVEGLIKNISNQNPEFKNLQLEIDVKDTASATKLEIEIKNNDHFDIPDGVVSSIQMQFDQTGLLYNAFNVENSRIIERGLGDYGTPERDFKANLYMSLNREILKSLKDNRETLTEDMEVHHELAQEALKEFEWRRQQGISLMELGDKYIEGTLNTVKNSLNPDRLANYHVELASRGNEARAFDITRLEGEVDKISSRQLGGKVNQDIQKKASNNPVTINFDDDVKQPEPPEVKASERLRQSRKP